MNRNNFKSVYTLANTLYGTTLDEGSFEDIALNGWELIGNRQTRLYQYTTSTENKRVLLPCNVEFIEAVFSPQIESRFGGPELNYGDVYSSFVEQYIELWKKDKSVFYNKGTLIKYRQEGEYLVFDKDYSKITILYHGVIADDEGLPYLNDKEVQALAAYVAYADLYKKSLVLKDANSVQLASLLKQDWLRLCNSARIPVHLTQNEINDVLDVKHRWDRKVYGKSFKPLL